MNQKQLDYLASLGPIMPADVNPTMPGWYAREYSYDGKTNWLFSRDYWDGENWFTGWADGTRETLLAAGRRRWRGLAEPAVAGDDGPEFGDGCDGDGFAGGCNRFGHTPETCPHHPPPADQRDEVPAMGAAEFTGLTFPGHPINPDAAKRRRYRIASRALFAVGIALVVATIVQLVN